MSKRAGNRAVPVTIDRSCMETDRAEELKRYAQEVFEQMTVGVGEEVQREDS